uniref:Uncharacterized protein n=1 Tax=Picea sitchensis TaxID=3332 RepID=A9NQT7_PICSI|nr:unknown [Picea sitchensis]
MVVKLPQSFVGLIIQQHIQTQGWWFTVGVGEILEGLDMETLVIYLFHTQSRPYKDFRSNK